MTPEQIEVAARKLCELHYPNAIRINDAMEMCFDEIGNYLAFVASNIDVQRAIKYALEQK